MSGGSTDEDFIKQLDSKGVIFDFYASLADGTSINITIENLKTTGNTKFNEESYAKTAADQLKEQFEAAGATVEKSEKGTVTFAGKESHCVFVKISSNGTSVYETQVPIKKGNYMASVTFASSSEETVNELVKKFSAL